MSKASSPTNSNQPEITNRRFITFLKSLEKKTGLSAADLLAGAFGGALVMVDAKTAGRIEEVEKAADLEPGSVLETLLEVCELWWADEEPAWVVDFVEGGWELSDAEGVRKNLEALHARWRSEDGASPEADEERRAKTAEQVAAVSDPHARSATIFLDAELIEAARAYFPTTEYGSLSGFIEARTREEFRKLVTTPKEV